MSSKTFPSVSLPSWRPPETSSSRPRFGDSWGYGLRFAGQAERDAYTETLRGFSNTTIGQVATVKRNEKNEGLRHIAIAIAYGLINPQMRQLNKIITTLIKERGQAKKANNTPAFEKARELLFDLREAIKTVLLERGFDENGNPKKA
jgi:hypothetical protein